MAITAAQSQRSPPIGDFKAIHIPVDDKTGRIQALEHRLDISRVGKESCAKQSQRLNVEGRAKLALMGSKEARFIKAAEAIQIKSEDKELSIAALKGEESLVFKIDRRFGIVTNINLENKRDIKNQARQIYDASNTSPKQMQKAEDLCDLTFKVLEERCSKPSYGIIQVDSPKTFRKFSMPLREE